mgnify:CR=1 FL=1
MKKFSPIIAVILKYSKDLNINLNIKDDKGRTPLHYLTLARSEKLVEQFLQAVRTEYGIEFNINAMDHEGKTPLYYTM